MPLSAKDVSVAVFVRGLTSLQGLLRKGEAHAVASGRDPAELLTAQLAPGMYDLAVQVHWAAEGAKLAVARLLGEAPAPLAADAKTFDALHRQLEATIASLDACSSAALEAGLDRTIEIEHRGGSMKFVGSAFLLEFAIPSFFFHVTTAYAILRHQGVALTKGDFMGALG